MIATPHILFGPVVYGIADRMTTQLSAIIFWPFLSHFLLDAIPHADYGLKEPILFWGWFSIGIDISIGLLLLAIAMRMDFSIVGVFDSWKIVAAAFFAILPDVMVTMMRSFDIGMPFVVFHDFFHTDVRPAVWFGCLTQFLVCMLSFLLLYSQSKTRG